MERSKTPPRPEPGHPEVSASQGIQLIDTQIAKADELLQNRPLKVDDYSTWELLTRNYLEKAFGRHSSNISTVIDVGKYGQFPMDPGEEWWENHSKKSSDAETKT